jgi:methionyl-tRNA formyltransferase
MTVPFNPSATTAILIGDESLTIACGDFLLAGGHSITAVVTRDDAVRTWAMGQGLAVLAHPSELLETALQANWLLSIANLRMIPQSVLDLPAKGAINFHDGPLPRYAGLNTPAWAIINGEATHGVSWHVTEGGVDEGDLLAQRMIDIAADETAFSLNSKCYAAGMESFGAVLTQLESGTLERTPQDLTQRSYFAKDQRPANMGVLDLNMDAEKLSCLVRGLDFGAYWNPLGTAKLRIGDQMLSVGTLEHADESAPAGAVVAVSSDGLTVGTGTTAVHLRGFTTLEGDTVDLTKLTAAGDVLAAGAIAEISAKGEDHWRSVLTASESITLPLAKAGDGAVQEVLQLTVPRNACVAQGVRPSPSSRLASIGDRHG